MKKLLLLLLLLFTIGSSAQKILKFDKVSDGSIYVKGNDFEGVIFTNEKSIDTYRVPASQRFTPNKEDIILAERILQKHLDTSFHGWKDRIFDHKRLKKYIRQYVGYINKKGERVIYINAFIRDPGFINKKDWLDHIPIVEDGGDDFWHLKINLNTSHIFELGINPAA